MDPARTGMYLTSHMTTKLPMSFKKYWTLVLVCCILFIVPSKPEWSNLDGIYARYLRHFVRYLMPHLLAAIYIHVKGHPKYCPTRWIEDQPVADRALDVWSSVVSTVKHWISLSKSKRPKNNNSYDTLVKHYQDLLIPAKCHFFSSFYSSQEF